MAKKDYISFDINPVGVEQLNLTPEKVSYASAYYKSLTINTIKKKAIDYNLILLRGQKGEVAYVRNDSYYRHRKITLITEFPLSLTVGEQRNWISKASKFFKNKFISDWEKVSPGKEFKKIKDRPYIISKGYGYDPAKPQERKYFETRFRKYSDSAPYASKTTRKQDLEARNKWIRKRYAQLKEDKSLPKYFTRYEKISNELNGETFGNLKITTPPDIDTIKNIIYSKPKKISD